MKKNKIDKTIILYILFFFIISILSIDKASIYLSSSLGNLVLKQVIWYLIGFLLMFLIIKTNINILYDYIPIFYILNIILLFGLLFIGEEINGSRCWYIINGFSFQPSEFMKITLLLMQIYLINKYKNKTSELKLILIILLTLFIPTILTLLEPDTGSIIIYCISTFFIFLSLNINKKYYIIMFSFIGLFLILFFSLYFFKQDLFINLLGSSFFYRIDRLIKWTSSSGMQLENSKIAIGSSYLFGFNKSPIYFPEAGTDFIFSIFVSSYGFIGLSIFLLITVLFDLRILKKAKNKKNKTLVYGVLGIILYQQIQNISMTIGLLPITGITLPFISYGGSSLLSIFLLISLILKKEVNY